MTILTTLLLDTFTLEDFKRRLFLLRSFIGAFYFHGPLPDKSSISADDNAWLIHLLGDHYQSGTFQMKEELKQFSESALYSELSTIEQTIANTPPLDLFLPYPLEKKDVTRIGKHLRELGVLNLLRISYDPSLLGGCALSHEGVYKDYSLRKKLEETKEARKEIIMKALSF